MFQFFEKNFESDKVRDHCHLTGRYRGPAQKKCNFNVAQKQSNFIPFMYYNFSNYVCHMFFKRLVDMKKDKVKFDILPKINEEYTSVTYGCIRFIDSYRFLSMSLGGLVTNLDEDDFKILKKEFPDKWQHLNRKPAYPYEIFNSIDDYKKPVDNLKKGDFFSKLKNKSPDDEEIQRKKEIIDKFDIKNGEELTDIYLKSDVILLADVFEKFIKIPIEEYGINPLYCVSLPGYTWQCGMKYTDIKLRTLQDKDLILTLENNIRGGISSVMGDRYVQSDNNKNILYVDANNLYGWAMSEYLPYHEIKFDRNVILEDIINTPGDSDIGYFIEVDLKYPDNIKEKTKNFPFAPLNKKINPEKFSGYMKKIKPNTFTQTSKMICDWSDKKNYLVHYRMLKFYIRHGKEVVKVHNVISFIQTTWLEKYISFNTQKRNRAKNDFEKDFYKLLNKSFYGKTMENVRNRIKVDFVEKEDTHKIIKQQSKLPFNGIHKSYENYDSYTFKQNEVLMDKPIYIGFTVLELSKLLLYDTYYDKLQQYFGQDNLKLHYMDCDNFVLSIQTQNIINDLKNLEDLFDFSNLNENHELFGNKKKL